MDVLVAHASGPVRQGIRSALESIGAAVHEADSAADALSACRTSLPDVALLGVELCDEGGELALLGEIKRDPDLFRTAVVLVGDVTPEVAVEAQTRGAEDILREQAGEAEVVARVRAARRAAALRDQLLERERGLEELAYSDELTRLYNRRFLSRQLSALIHSATRHARDLSVVLVDIDRFKAINDVHGHARGDAVLARVAARLQRCLREEDYAGRWGGEEFLIVLPDVDGPGAETTAEKLRRAVGDRPISGLGVTVSAGWAEWQAGESADDLLRRADAALYEAKRLGRDQVRAAHAA